MLLDSLYEVIDDEGYVSMPSGYEQFLSRKMYSDDGETTSKNYSTTTSEFYTVGSYNMRNGKFQHWLNTTDYMEALMERPNNSITYFHNIGYDGEFIVWWLLENGFKQVHNIDSGYDNGYGKVRKPLNAIITEPSFQANIDGMNTWYLLSLYIPIEERDKYGKRKLKKVTLLDSFKIMPMSVDSIAKTFDLKDDDGSEFRKGDINHELVRRPNEELDEEVLDYLRKDCKIVGDALNIMHKEGAIKSTMSSNSLDTYKRVMWDDEFCEQEIYNRQQNFLRDGDPSKKFTKPSFTKIRDYEFRNLFPILNPQEDEFVHKAYKGGTTQHVPEHTYEGSEPKVINGGIGIDINSSYPDKLANRFLPYGNGVKFEGEYEFDLVYPLAIFMVEFKYKLKDKKLPFIQHKNNRFFKSTKIQRSSGYMSVTMCVTSVFWRLIQECYDVWNVEFFGGYKYKASKDNFSDFIKKFMKIKASNKGVNAGKEFNAKLTMNSLYGKFGSKKERSHKEISINEKGLLNFMDVDDEDAETVYTPLACFVTDYGREQLIMTGNANFDRVLYMDTDSLYMEGSELPVLPELPGLEGHMKPLQQELHKTDLGMWDIETLFVEGKFLRAKTYRLVKYKKIKTENGHIVKDGDELKTVVKCAGMPEGIKKRVTNENFVLGSSFKPLWKDELGNFSDTWYQGCLNVIPGKLTPVRVKKGKYLEHRTFTIKFERGTDFDELNDKIKVTMNDIKQNTENNEKHTGKLKKMVDKFQDKVDSVMVKNEFEKQKSKKLLLDKLGSLIA